MKTLDGEKFLQALIQEVDAHIESEHWELIRSEDVPGNAVIFDLVWAMRRKRNIKTRQVYKHKARLNIHGRPTNSGHPLRRNIQSSCPVVLCTIGTDSEHFEQMVYKAGRCRPRLSIGRHHSRQLYEIAKGG